MSANKTATVFTPVTSDKTSIDNSTPSGGSSSNGSSTRMFAIGFAVGGAILLLIAVIVLFLQSRKTALKRQFESIRSRSSKRQLTKARASPADSPSTLSRARSSPAMRSNCHGASPFHRLGYTSVPVDGSPRHNRVSPIPPSLATQSQGSRESHMYNNPDMASLHAGRDSVASKASHTYSNPDLPGQPWHDDISDDHLYNDPNYRSSEDYDHLADPENAIESNAGNEWGKQLHYATSRLPTNEQLDEDGPYGTTTLERVRNPTRSPQSVSPAHQAHKPQSLLPWQMHRRSSSLGQMQRPQKQILQPNLVQPHLRPLRATASLSNLLADTSQCKTPSLRSLKGLRRSPNHQAQNTTIIRESSKEDENTTVQWEEAVYYKSSSILPSFGDHPTQQNSSPASSDSLGVDASHVKLPKVKVDPGYVLVNVRHTPPNDSDVRHTPPNDSTSKHASVARKEDNQKSDCCPSDKPSISPTALQEAVDNGRQAVVVSVVHRPQLHLVSSEPMLLTAANDQAHPLERVVVLGPAQLAGEHTDTAKQPVMSSCRRSLCENALGEDSVRHTSEGQVAENRTEQSEPENQVLDIAISMDQGTQSQAVGEHDYWVLESPNPAAPTQAV